MNHVEQLKQHADFCAQRLEAMRKDGNAENIYEYTSVAKEYRLTVKQLDEMGELNKEEKKNALTEMRVLFNKKAM